MIYDVIQTDNLARLIKLVNEKAKENFKPYGNLVVNSTSWENEREGYIEHETTYYQVIVKK